MTQEALKLVLETLYPIAHNTTDDPRGQAYKAIAALEKALAQTQEPVAWMDADGNVSDNNDHKCFSISLYTHPPQRTWVGLTIEEIASCCRESTTTQLSFYNAIEAKLKDKNT